MDIGGAVAEMHAGRRVARAGWNGKGMYIELQVPDAHSKMTEPYVYMKTAQGGLIPWLCSQADLLARDWTLVALPAQPSPEHIWDKSLRVWRLPGLTGQAINPNATGA